MSTGVTIPCSHCGGSGQIEFTGVFADTLKLLKAEREPINGAELARKAGVTTEAMANRLVWLETHGFAKRERYGRQNRWIAA